MDSLSDSTFDQHYQTHLKHLKLKGLQPKTIDAYARAIRRIGKRFDGRIDDLTEQQLTDYKDVACLDAPGVEEGRIVQGARRDSAN